MIKENPKDFLEQEAREAGEFMRGHGIMDIRERRKFLIEALNKDEQKIYHEYEDEFDQLEEKIKELPEVKRLHGISQLSCRPVGMEKRVVAGADIITQSFHTRFMHSELMAEQVKIVGIKSGLDLNQIKNLIASAWLHDIGHSAYSHFGDELLIEQGHSNHEERTLEYLKNPAIQELLVQQSIDYNLLVQTLQEKGDLGAIQSLSDTLSYLVIDGAMMGKNIFIDQGSSVLATIRGVKEGKIKVINSDSMQQVLECRAKMMKEVYYHPASRMMSAGFVQLLRIGIQKGFITIDEIKRGGDNVLKMKLQSLVQKDPGAAIFGKRTDDVPKLAKYKDLYSMSSGLIDLTRWDRIIFNTNEKLQSYLNSQPVDKIEKSCVSKPYDYTKKKITVLMAGESGEFDNEVTLQAKETKLREEDNKFILFIPK